MDACTGFSLFRSVLEISLPGFPEGTPFDKFCRDNTVELQDIAGETLYAFVRTEDGHKGSLVAEFVLKTRVPDVRLIDELTEQSCANAYESQAASVISFIKAHGDAEGSWVWYLEGQAIQYLVLNGTKRLRAFEITEVSSWDEGTVVFGPV